MAEDSGAQQERTGLWCKARLVVHSCAPCEAGLGGRGVAQAAAAPAGKGSTCAGSGRRAARAWHKGGSDWERWCWCLRRRRAKTQSIGEEALGYGVAQEKI